MAENSALYRARKLIERNTAQGSARQHNGDQIYSHVGNLHQGDAYLSPVSVPFVPRSGYLSPQRWIDEPKNNAALVEAATHGQLQRLAHLLKQPDKDVDYLNPKGMSALHYAVLNSHEEAVKVLLDQGGANPGLQQSNRTGPTPLALAARMGQSKIVRLLLGAGAPIESTWLYFTPSKRERVRVMSEAIIGGNIDVVAKLVKCGAVLNPSPNALWQHEISPLTLAMLVGRPELLKLLLDLGAELTWELRVPVPLAERLPSGSMLSFGQMNEGYLEISSLALAILRNDVHMLQILLKRKPPSLLVQEAFNLAAMTADLDAMDCLLRSGVNVDYDIDGVRALHLASYFGVTAAVDRLLKDGADPLSPALASRGSRVGMNDFTIMRPEYRQLWRTTVLASFGPFTYPLTMLVQSDTRCKPWALGFPAVSLAVGHPKVLKLLISSGVSVDSETTEAQYTPLHVAAAWLHPDSARYLIDCGASLHSKSRFGYTPFDIALNQRHLEDYERPARRELLDMLRTTSLSVPELDCNDKQLSDLMTDQQRRAKLRTKALFVASASSATQTSDIARSAASSWALSERYSASSWALSERYSFRSHHLSQDCDIGELDEEREAPREPTLTAISEDSSHGGDIEPASSDSMLESMEILVALDLGSQQRHDTVGNVDSDTVANKRHSRCYW